MTVTNTGTTPYAGILLQAPATGSLDDVTPNGDQTATSGTLVVGGTGVSWTGNIPVGGVVTITGTVTVKNPDTGDRSIVARVQTTAPGSNCPTGSADPRCFFTIPVLLPGLSIVTTAGAPVTTPGATVAFTVTLTNSGESPYPGAVVTIPLAGLVGDSVYAGGAQASAGTVSASGSGAAQVLTWTGDLAVAAVVTVTYQVTVRNPDPGGKVLVARASSTVPGSSCPPASPNAGCAATVVVLTPGLTITTTADVASAVAGATVTWTIAIHNTGQTAYAGATVTDALGGVLDDATYGTASATTGTVTYDAPTLTWTGDLAAGATATVTYTVAVTAPPGGDRRMTSTATSAATGSNCPTGGADGRCTATVTLSELTFLNTADVTTATPTDVVRYTATITNTGATPYTGITADALLAGALDDATYNGDATTTSGTLVLVPGSGKVVWTGDLAPGATTTVTGTLTVLNPDPGDRVMSTVVTSAAAGNNCPVGGVDPRCRATVTVLIPALTITKTADASTATPGDTVGYTIAIANTGPAPYAGATVTDRLDAVLTDATYGGDAVASSGAVSFAGSTLSWTGALAVGTTVTVSYSATVRNPNPGDGRLVNTATSEAIGSSCPAAAPAPACTSTVPVLRPGLTIAKTADTSTATPGDQVHYTVTVANTGETPYAGATVTDALTQVLDDATYDGNAAATSGTVSVTGAVLTWTGDLAVGAAATLTYSVTVGVPGAGDGLLVNAVTSAARDTTCPVAGTDPGCTTTVTVLVPGLTLATAGGPTSTVPGGTVRFTVTATNTGGTTYPGASFTVALTGALDDAVFGDDATATSGTLGYSAPNLTWTGDLAVGAAVTVSWTVAVLDPDAGDRSLRIVVTSSTRGSSCPAPGNGAGCSATVPVLLPGLAIVLAADVATATPGDTVHYTLTVANSGQTPYPEATVTVPLGGVLEDATWVGDQAADSGSVSYAEPVVTWTGAVGLGVTVRVTFSVLVADVLAGDRVLTATALSTAAGSSCLPSGPGPLCSSTVTVLAPELSVVAVADRTEVVAGGPVEFTVTITDTGETPYAGAVVRIDLAGALDDAVYRGDVSATTGSVAYAAGVLTWTGDLAVGGTAVVTYTVDVSLPVTGDHSVTGVATSTDRGSSCPPPGTDPGCAATVTVLVPGLTITKTMLADAVVSGDTVRYRIEVVNSGEAPQPDASFADSLTGVLDDAVYPGDATASTGTVSYAGQTLTWVGALAVGESATITYTVAVTDPDPGDRTLTNVVTSAAPNSNCPSDSADPRCRTDTTVTPQSLTLTGLTEDFTLRGLPGDRVEQDAAVAMTVTTNSTTGYAVTVRSRSAVLQGSVDSIPIASLQMRRNGSTVWEPMSDTQPLLVHRQGTASAPSGDAVSSDYAVEVPFVPSGAYSTVLDYVVATQ